LKDTASFALETPRVVFKAIPAAKPTISSKVFDRGMKMSDLL